MIKDSMPVIAVSSLAQSWLLLLGITSMMFAWLQWGAPRWARLRSAYSEAERMGRWLAYAPLLLMIMSLAVGLTRAWRLMWLGDDSFISFRYSEMFARGEGLVFNSGEWVEGYTNFLWTWGLGLLAKVGAPIPQTALIFNLLSFVGAVWLTDRICRRMELGLLPTLVMTCSYPCLVFATSGLETMSAAFLVLWGAYELCKQRPTWAGIAFTLGALMRPDHLLFWGCGGLSLLLNDLSTPVGSSSSQITSRLKRLRWSIYLRFSAPLILLYGSYMTWRVWAYASWLPNTYYAKSGDLSYWSQGGVYLASFLLGAGVWWLALTSLIYGALCFKRRRTSHRATPSRTEVDESSQLKQPTLISGAIGGIEGDREDIQVGESGARRTLITFCSLSLLIFTTYVVKVGGDFMLYRFFVVLFPLCWIAYPLKTPTTWRGRVSLSLAVALALTPVELIKYQKKRWRLAAEETFYQVESFEPFRLTSRYARYGHDLRLLSDRITGPLHVAIDCVGMIGFYGEAKIFDLFGLTSPEIAHRPLKKRGRPGHEKYGTLRDALKRRSRLSNVDLWKRSGYKKTSRYTRFKINKSKFYLLRYDSQIAQHLSALKEQGVKIKLPLTPEQAITYAQARAAKGPNKTLAHFLQYFYARELAKHPELSKVIKLLKAVPQKASKDQNLNVKDSDQANPNDVDLKRAKPKTSR